MKINKLTKEQYNVCFLKGTEAQGSGKYYKNFSDGEYRCVACGQMLFKSDTKYDSGTGWPAFWETADPKAIKKETDTSMGMARTEVMCSKCGSHLGHVFEDGPKTLPDGRQATGLRYCINSVALDFASKKK